MENVDSKSNSGHNKEAIDFCPSLKSFKTDQGSVYKKLPDGTFLRQKYDGTEYKPMEWTMFTDNEGDNELRMARLKLQMMPKTKKLIYFQIAEFDKNGDVINVANHRDEILDINNNFDLLTVEADGDNEPKAILQTAITFKPKIGYTVFEFSDNGVEYHLGDLISDIETVENK